MCARSASISGGFWLRVTSTFDSVQLKIDTPLARVLWNVYTEFDSFSTFFVFRVTSSYRTDKRVGRVMWHMWRPHMTAACDRLTVVTVSVINEVITKKNIVWRDVKFSRPTWSRGQILRSRSRSRKIILVSFSFSFSQHSGLINISGSLSS